VLQAHAIQVQNSAKWTQSIEGATC
jgi:hypothetical protein